MAYERVMEWRSPPGGSRVWHIFALWLWGWKMRSVAPLTTLLDPDGFPLLAQHAEVDATVDHRGRHGGSGLGAVVMIPLGNFTVHQFSTTVEPPPSFRSELDAAIQGQLAEAMQAEHPEGSGSAPILMIDGHACALSLDDKAEHNKGRYTLRDPYAWESRSETTAFLLPQWISDMIRGEPGGGALLAYRNNSAWEAPSEVAKGAAGTEASPAFRASMNGEEPYVQIASWGRGAYNPMVRVSSTGLTLTGQRQKTAGEKSKVLQTECGDLKIASAADLHLVAGTKSSGNAHIKTTNFNRSIFLYSEKLQWTPNSSLRVSAGSDGNTGINDSLRTKKPRQASTLSKGMQGARLEGDLDSPRDVSVIVDPDGLLTRGMTTVNLTADSSFRMAVDRSRTNDARQAITPQGGSVTGDQESVNVSAGAVGVEALSGRVEVAGVKGVSLKSRMGDVALDSSCGRSYLQLTANTLQGTAETLTLRGYVKGAEELSRSIEGDAIGSAATFAEGAFLNLTGAIATLGGPQGASVDADDEIRLRANNKSLVRVSSDAIFVTTSALVLQSVSTARSSRPISTSQGRSVIPKSTDARAPHPTMTSNGTSVLSMDGGSVTMNASKTINFESSIASLKIIGHCGLGDHIDDEGTRTKGKGLGGAVGLDSASGRKNCRSGALLARADVVEIVARSTAGVVITAENGVAAADGGESSDIVEQRVGGRLEVMAEGVAVKGQSADVTTSQSIVLQIQRRQREESKDAAVTQKKANAKSSTGAEKANEDDGPRMELNVYGVKITTSPSESVGIHAGRRIVMDTPELAISHDRARAEARMPASQRMGGVDGRATWGESNREGSSGLWSNGSSLTGKADHLIQFQAGHSPVEASRGKKAPASGFQNSHVSIQTTIITVEIGSDGSTAASRPIGSPPILTGEEVPSSIEPRRGLSVAAVGNANVSSTEGMNLFAGQLRIVSSNQTLLNSPGGILLAGSAPSVDEVVNSCIPPIHSTRRNKRHPGGGNILMAPGEGAGVGIGPVFASTISDGKLTGIVPSLLYVTNSTHAPGGKILLPPSDAHIAVESSGDSALAVLSPRGSASSIRFGCENLTYSGGISIQHHLDGPGGDSLVLEVASSPGRILGDARGRWVVGAVAKSGPEATLHVRSLPQLPISNGQNPPTSQSKAAGAGVPLPTLLVESQVSAALGSAAIGTVIQLLSATSPPPTARAQNALVFTSTIQDKRQRPETHQHWLMSQLGQKHGLPPPWVDPATKSPSWSGGMALAYTVGGGRNGWISGLNDAAMLKPGDVSGENEQVLVTPTVIFGTNGRSGFGTGPTSARVTVGGAALAEQVLIMSDHGMVRDVSKLGDQGRQEAIEAIREVDVVTYGWKKEASAAYGLESDVRQIGTIAQQVEKAMPSVVWEDPSTRRKAVSHSRLLATLLAAFQYLDTSVTSGDGVQDERLGRLETDVLSANRSSAAIAEGLRTLETTAERGLTELQEHARGIAKLDGRVTEQHKQMEYLATSSSTARETAAKDRELDQVWRNEHSKREKGLMQDIRELTARLNSLEEQRAVEIKEQEKRLRAQDEQIRALNLRLGAYQASAQTPCEDTALRENMEELRRSHESFQNQLEATLLDLRPTASQSEEEYFLAEIQRAEDRLRSQLERQYIHSQIIEYREGDDRSSAEVAQGVPAASRGGAEAGAADVRAQMLVMREHLEKNKGFLREEAWFVARRRREHVDAFKAMGDGQ